MKIRIWKQEPEPEPTIYLRLEGGNADGIVVLVAVDENGARIDSGVILEITADGIGRWPVVNPDLGFSLDSEGHVRVLR